MSCFSARCHQTQRTGEKPPQYHPNLCWLSGVLGQDIVQILLSEGARWEGYSLTRRTPSQTRLTSKLHKHPESNRAGAAAGGGQLGGERARTKSTSTPAHAPSASPSLFCQQPYVYTIYRDFKPTHKQLSSPKEALRAGDKGTAALRSFACKEADRELIYLPSSALG